MSEQKKQNIRRVSDDMINAFKSVFAENFELVIAIRKSLLQLTLTDFDKSLIANNLHSNDNLYRIVSDVFNPQLRGDEPLNQVVDLWATIDTKNENSEFVGLQISSRATVIKYIQEQLDILFNKSSVQTIVLSSLLPTENKDSSIEDIHAKLYARNEILKHIETQLTQLYLLAGMKGETIEQTQKRLMSNSAK